jgi:hypothetical protein
MKIKLIILLIILAGPCLTFAQLKVEDLTIDTAITGFRFAANMQGTHVYTPNGAPDLNTINPSAFSFSILPNATYQTAFEQILMLINMGVQDGYSQTDLVKKDTTINGNKAWYVSLTETLKGTDYKNMLFHAFYLKGDAAIIFVSGDLDNGKHREKYKSTFYKAISLLEK